MAYLDCADCGGTFKATYPITGRTTNNVCRQCEVPLCWPCYSAGEVGLCERCTDQRGEIYRLYEETFGVIGSSLIAEELAEAEQEYPAEWIRRAFQEAVARRARQWAYVRAILRNWEADRGKADNRSARDRYRGGEAYEDIVRWR